MTLKEKLSKIQQEIKAPKNRHNDFGNYDYRNAEDILNTIKPFEDKYNVAFIVWDDIQQIGDRFYVKATAAIMDTESDDQICATAYAREPDEKRGMDPSQISGTASSYARKYCLNGLLLLDDVKDPDSNEYAEQTGAKKKGNAKADGVAQKQQAEEEKIDQAKVNTLESCIAKNGGTVAATCKYYGVEALKDFTLRQFIDCMNRMGEKA